MFGETYGTSDSGTLPIGKEVFQFLKSKMAAWVVHQLNNSLSLLFPLFAPSP